MRRHPLSGFTIIEMLVVIAIIGVLIALLMPAINAARAHARLVQCSNNLKQIGDALHNYQSGHNIYPPGAIPITDSNGDLRGEYSWSAFSMLLPYLENELVYDRLNFSVIAWTGTPALMNSTAFMRRIKTLVCPSDVDPPGADFSTPRPGCNYGVSAGPMVLGHGDIMDQFKKKRWAGPFRYAMGTRDVDIRDGSSNTVAAMETVVGRDPLNNPNVQLHYSVAGAWPGCVMPGGCSPLESPAMKQGFLTFSEGLTSSLQAGTGLRNDRGRYWHWGHPKNTIMHTLLTPNAEDADGGFGRAANVGNLGECNSGCMSNARSNHGGGANVLLMDGTVKFVDDSIDQEIWWGVGSIYGGETKGKADL